MKGLFDWLDIFIIVWLWMRSIFMSNERNLATGDIADFDFTVVKMEAQSIVRFWCRCQSIFENIGLCWGTSLQYTGPWWCPSENFGMVWIRWLDWWKHNKFTLDWWKETFSSCYSLASRISFLLTDGSSYKGICAAWSTFLLPSFVDPEVGDPPEMEEQSQRQGAN